MLAAAEREPGQAADEGVLRRVEGVTGADLSGVRVHTGTASAQAAEAVSAQAYTVGHDVHFGTGRYRPGTPGGDRLLAHELVHAAQQGPQPAGTPLQAKAEVSEPGDLAEQEADRLADKAIAGGGDVAGAGAQVTPSVMKVSRKIQREEKEGSSEQPATPAVEAKAKLDAEEESEEDKGEEVGPPDASALAGGGGDEGGGAVSAGSGGEGGGGAGGAEGAQEVSAKDGAAAKEGGGQAEQAAPVVVTEGAQASNAPEKKEVVSEGQADAGASGTDNKAASSQAATENTASPQAKTQTPAQPTAESKPATPASDAKVTAPAAENKAAAAQVTENKEAAPTIDDEAKAPGAKKQAGAPATEKQAGAPVTESKKATTQQDVQKDPASARQALEEKPTPDRRQPQGAAASISGEGNKAPTEREPTSASAAAPDMAPGGGSPSPAPVAAVQSGNVSPEAPDAKPKVAGRTPPEPARNANSGAGGGGGGGGASKNAESDPGFQSVKGQVAKVAAGASSHAPAAQEVAEAHGAAQSPSNEVESKAEARHMGALSATEPAPFSRNAFKAALRQKIAEAAPKNLEEASNFKGNNQLGQVKSAVAEEVGKGKEQTTGPIEKKNREAPDQAGIQPKTVTPLSPREKSTPPSVPNAAAAAPKRKPDADVDMKSGPAEVDRKMAEAEVTEPQLQKSNESKFQAAVEAKKDAKADADAGPKKYRQVEQPALAGAQAGAEALVQQQLQAMGGGREAALQSVLGKQQAAKGQDEQARAQVAQKVQQIFGACQQKVEARLQRLDAEVNAAFDAGAGQARKQFEAYVGQRMDAYKEERYSGFAGKGRWIKDQFLGLPSEVNAFYTDGKQRYLAAMEATIDRVATMVETGLREATAEVGRGKKEVDEYVRSLPASLRQVGQQAQAQIQAQFDGLGQSIKDKQGELVDTLAQKYNDETQKLDQRIGELKAQNRGLVDKALDLVGDVIQTIKKLGEMLRSVLARVAGIVGRILADPIGFIGNLVRGAKEGFSRFSANIEQHLQQGLLGWLTGALAGAGLQMPASFDLKGIFSLVSQVLNMTWQAIRTRAVRILGERAVHALEKGSEIVKLLMTGGPAAIWEHVKSFVGDLKTVVVDQIKNFVITKVISAGITWILSLLNPASAFVKACKAIYDIVMFFVERAAQIADLVSAVLDSIEAVAGGAVGAMVAKIEGALVKALPVVIGFLASLLGIGGISEKVKAIIQKVRVPIEKAIDWVLKNAWEVLKKTGKWLGLVKDKDKKQDDAPAKKQAHKDQVGAKVTFTAHGETHATWVDAKSGVPVPMVASTPSVVKAKIEEWRPRLKELPQVESKRAGSLIGKAIGIEKSVSGLAVKAQGGGDEAALKAKQQQLADTLAQLFEVMAPNTDPSKSFADQDPMSTLKTPKYQQFKERFMKLANDLALSGGDARAQEIWLKTVNALQRTHTAYQAVPTDAAGRKDLSSDAFQQVMSQFEPIAHALKPYMDRFAHGKKSWAFWSGKAAREVAKRSAESALEKSALGSLFDDLNINGSWDIQMWASLSKAYATHAAQHVGEAEFRGFVGMGSSAEQSIFNKIEQPTFVGMLNEHAKANLKISWFAVAGDPKTGMNQPDWRFRTEDMEGVYARGGRAAMVALAESENKRRLELWKHKKIDEAPGGAPPEGGIAPIAAAG